MACELVRIRDMEHVGFHSVLISARRRLVVFFGEHQGVRGFDECERALVEEAIEMNKLGFLGLAAFTLAHQRAIDSWLSGTTSWRELVDNYYYTGGFYGISHYKALMELAASVGARVLAMSPPWHVAKAVAREGLGVLRDLADDTLKRFMGGGVRLDYEGYAEAVERLASMLRGRGAPEWLNGGHVVEAQALMDHVIAGVAARALATRYWGVVIAWWPHVELPGSAPKRLLDYEPAARVAVVTSRVAGRDSIPGPLASYLAVPRG